MSNPIKYTDIDDASAGCVYDWNEFHVLRGTDGNMYTAEAAGCSCDAFFRYEWKSSDDDTRLLEYGVEATPCPSWIEACNRIKAWANEEGYDRDERQSTGMQLIERLTESKPPAFDASAARVEGETL